MTNTIIHAIMIVRMNVMSKRDLNDERCRKCGLDFRMVGLARVENGTCENCVAIQKAKMKLIGMNMQLALPKRWGG